MEPGNDTHVLVVEDEEDIAELVEYNLLKQGFSVEVAVSGEEALVRARRRRPGLVLLDLMLPGVDGYEVCRRLKAEPDTREIPVVMVTAKGEEGDVVKGLELGADDYIVKPFSPRVLMARVRAILRRRPRREEAEQGTIAGRGIEIRPGRHEVLVEGKEVSLTFTEFQILKFLASRPGWVFTRRQIIDAVRGDDYHATERAIDVHVRSLRKKLSGGAGWLETVRGVGYRFRE